MLPGIFFILTRLGQLLFLIPILGMLAYFVHGYVNASFLTPNFILVLFIVVTIASVWCLATLLFYGTAKHHGHLISFVDACIWGGLIAGVYELRGIGDQSCSNFDTTSSIYQQLYVFDYQITKTCNMLKACFALAIIEILMFSFSVLLGFWIHHHHKNDPDHGDRAERRATTYTEKRSSRSRSRGGRRSRSQPGSNYYGGSDLEAPPPRDYRGPRGGSRGPPPPRSNYGGSRRG